jgi:hypothetical protein
MNYVRKLHELCRIGMRTFRINRHSESREKWILTQIPVFMYDIIHVTRGGRHV